MDKKVSIIVPVYNVATYLQECVDSIIHQTYTNLEIILVDDGSTDNSGEICDEYAKADSRVKVIHQKNGGAGKAKNTALDVVTGEYVAFLDGDDCFGLNYIKIMLETMEKNDADIVQCALSRYYKSGERGSDNAASGEYTAEAFLEKFLSEWTVSLFANKLFKATLLKEVRFYTGRLIDDEFFTYKSVIKASKICVIEDGLYLYRMRKTSVTSLGRWRQRLLDRIAYYTERYDIVVKSYPSLKKSYLTNLADNLIQIKNDTYEFPDLTKEANKCMRRYVMRVLMSSIPFKLKISYFLKLCSKPKGVIRPSLGENAWQDFYE